MHSLSLFFLSSYISSLYLSVWTKVHRHGPALKYIATITLELLDLAKDELFTSSSSKNFLEFTWLLLKRSKRALLALLKQQQQSQEKLNWLLIQQQCNEQHSATTFLDSGLLGENYRFFRRASLRWSGQQLRVIKRNCSIWKSHMYFYTFHVSAPNAFLCVFKICLVQKKEGGV